MTPEQWGELTRTLGVAAPLVLMLLYLLKQSNEERQKLTDRFLAALETTVTRAIDTQNSATSAIKDMSNAVVNDRRSAQEEHNRIVDAIGKIGRRDQ